MSALPGSRVLVTGAGGQLGSTLISSTDHFEFVSLTHAGLDIADAGSVKAMLDEARPGVIVNCAAWTAVDLAEQQEEAAYRCNADGPRNLADWCFRNSCHLVHISTDYVFDGQKPLFNAYVEEDAVAPVSVYGKSKLLGEEAIRDTGWQEYSILRTAWLYGRNGKNFLKTMLRLVLSDPTREYKVVADQYGSPTSADALARQIVAVIENNAYGTMHATSHGYCSWYEFACEFFSLMGIEHRLQPCKTEEYPTAAVRPENSILENAVLTEQGLDTFNDWRDDLALFVESYAEELHTEVEQALVRSTLAENTRA